MLVWKELSNRYRRTILSFLWPVVTTAAMLGIYALAFSRFMRVSLGPGTTPRDYLLFLFCGTVAWNAFAEASARSAGIIHENQGIVKKIVFPMEVFPLVLSVSSFLTGGVFLVLLAAYQAAKGRLTAAILFLPLCVMLQIAFTTAVGWLLAAAGAYYRDVREATLVTLAGWVFLTPVFYPLSMVPDRLRWLLYLNPMTTIIESYRRVLLFGLAPRWELWLPTAAAVGAFAWLSLGVFARLKTGFADVV